MSQKSKYRLLLEVNTSVELNTIYFYEYINIWQWIWFIGIINIKFAIILEMFDLKRWNNYVLSDIVLFRQDHLNPNETLKKLRYDLIWHK